jgi:hypothetical protein
MQMAVGKEALPSVLWEMAIVDVLSWKVVQ